MAENTVSVRMGIYLEQLYLDVLIADDLRSKIESKVYQEYERLPSEQQLCEVYHVQKMTVRASLQILKNEGVIFSVPKSGYYVKPARIKKDIRRFQSTTDLLQSQGRECRTQILRLEVRQANSTLARQAGIEPRTQMYFLERLRMVDGTSIAIEQSYIPADLFPGLMTNDLGVMSLYQVLAQQYNVQTDRAEMEVAIVCAGEHEAQLLSVEQGDPLIKESGRVYDRIGRMIEYTESFLLIDRFQFIS